MTRSTAQSLLALLVLAAGAFVASRALRGADEPTAESIERSADAPPVASDPPVEEDGGPGDFPTMTPTTPADVREIIRYCEEAGPGEIASLRYVALHSEDPLAASNALRALGRLAAVVDDRELIELLDDPRQRLRQEAVLALGQSGDPAAADLISPILDGDEVDLRPLVIQALGRLDCDKAWDVLEAYVPRNDKEKVFLRTALAAREREE